MSSSPLLLDRLVSASSSDDVVDALQSILEHTSARTMQWKDSDVYEALTAMMDILSTASYKQLLVEQGPVLVLQIVLQWLEQEKQAAASQLLSHSATLTSLLDCSCAASNGDGSQSNSTYPRVLSLQVMAQLCILVPSKTQRQLLELPHGLHRLALLLQDSTEDSAVRQEALLVGQQVAMWPSCAKVWVFENVCDSIITWAVDEGGLNGAPSSTLDCMLLLQTLSQHDNVSELVWASPIFGRTLAKLLDLRHASAWVTPKTIAQDDDLDSIISQTVTTVPTLTVKEEELLSQVFLLLETLMTSPKIRANVWKNHIPLSSLLWELALISPPPPGVKHVCAMPSARLQQLALEHVAKAWNSPESMDRHGALDRLLFLVCTGGSTMSLGVSQAALHVLRRTLPSDRAMEFMVHSLAPAMSDQDVSAPTCVEKLLHTVLEPVTTNKIPLIGALGALSVFLYDTTSREVMLQLSTKHDLIDRLLKLLDESDDKAIQQYILRFLCQWIDKAPTVIAKLLSSTYSTCLATQLSTNTAMGGLLLGMCMASMVDASGWTRTSILQILKKHSIPTLLGQLESYKTNTALPWKASTLECEFFLTWYSEQVLTVRRGIVLELTAAGSDNDEPLQRVLKHQQEEWDDMKRLMDTNQATIAEQTKQLELYQRRIASTPTQLDDLLDELTLANKRLEQRVAGLEQELVITKESMVVQENDTKLQLTDLHQKLQAANAQAAEANTEQEILRGEMEGLSSAYAALEQEFQNTPPQQSEGEFSSQEHGDLEALRTENARLRSDARAADDWMQMAVQRMNDMGAQQLALQQEMEMRASNKASAADLLAVQQELEQERARRQALEAQLASVTSGESSSADAALQQELEEEKKQRIVLAEQLSNARLDVTEALEHLGTIKTEKEEQTRKLENMEMDLTIAIAEATSLREAHRQLEMQVEAARLEGASYPPTSATNDEIDSLRINVQSLQDQLIQMQQDMDTALLRERVEIERRDETIRDLQSQVFIDRPLSSITTPDLSVKARDEEIAQLRSANEAAQEWMAKAVEHHTMLSEQVTALSDEKDALKRELRDLRNNTTQHAVSIEDHIQMETDLAEKAAELQDAELEIEEFKAKLQFVEEKLAAQLFISQSNASSSENVSSLNKQLLEQAQQIQELQAEIEKKDLSTTVVQSKEVSDMIELSQGQLQDALDRVLVLEAETSQLSLEKSMAQQLLDGARDEIQTNQLEISNRISEVESTREVMSSEMANVKIALSQREHDVSQLRKQLAEYVSTKEDLELLKSELISATDDNVRLKAELDSLKSGSVSVNERTESFEQVQNELKNLQNSKQALEQSREASMSALEKVKADLISVKQENAALSMDVDSKATDVEKLHARVNELENLSTKAQQKIVELEASHIASAVEIQRKDDEIVGLSVKVETFDLENNVLSDLTKALENDKAMLEHQIQDITNSQNANSADEATVEWKERVAIMEIELGKMQSESREVVELWEDRVLELETGTKALEDELEKQQQDASDVIEQWSSQCVALEQRIADMDRDISELGREKAALQKQVNHSEDISGKVNNLQSLLQAKEEEIRNLEESYRSQIVESEAKLEEMMENMNSLTRERESRTQESVNLTMQLSQLKERFDFSSVTMQNRINELDVLLQTEKDKAEFSSEKVQQYKNELEDRVVEHDANRTVWESERESLSAMIASLSQQNESCHIEIGDYNNQVRDLNASKDLVRVELDAKISELVSETAFLRDALESQQDEAKTAVEQWENHSAELEEQITTLERELQTTKAELCRATDALKAAEEEIRSHVEQAVHSNSLALQKQVDQIATQSEEVINQWQERVSELEDTVTELEEQLEIQQQEATDAIAAWQETCAALENDSTEAKGEYELFLQNVITTIKSIIERNENMLSPFINDDARTEINISEVSSASVIDSLKSAMFDIEKRVADILMSLMSERDKQSSLIDELNTQIVQKERINETLRRDLVLAMDSMVDKVKYDSDVSDLQQQHQEELCVIRAALEREQSAVASLEETMAAFRVAEEANCERQRRLDDEKVVTDAIKADLDESRIRQVELESELLKRETALVDTNDVLAKTKEALEESENSLAEFKARYEILAIKESKIQEELQSTRLILNEVEEKWNDEHVSDAQLLLLRDEECGELHRKVAQLQEELDGMNDALQVHVTDEISERATELATQALREEIMTMRDQLENDREKLRSEKEVRIAAQGEISRLKADMSILLRADDIEPDAPDRLKSLMMNAADNIQRKEREEIEVLRNSLERVMHDLASLRRSEKCASDMAASARLQASSFEQEVIAAKSDVAFLTQTMDEMRQAEAGRIASFEYRITALEDDRETLRRFHADELENVRNELYHVSMEKDRVLQTLKDSEKTNAALLYTNTKEHEVVGPNSTPSAELAKLRVAHAQLLAAVAEEGSRTERRIKEAIAAIASSTEADLIVERELRFSAEKAVESMRVHVENLKLSNSLPQSPMQPTEIERLACQLQQSKEETKALHDQVLKMRREHEQFRAESKAAMDDLVEKYRQAQVKARKLEREGQFDSEVSIEAARLRIAHNFDSQNTENWLVKRESTPEEEKKDFSGQNFLPSEAFDYIQQQKEAIQEERHMYQELLAEHDDLLALLAQQDLEKASLNSALLNAVGAEAVAAAFQEAEINAVKQFGRYIQLQ